MCLGDAAVQLREVLAHAILVQLSGLRVLHCGAAVIFEIGADIACHRLDAFDDLIAAPRPCDILAHQTAQFVYLLLQIVNRAGLTASSFLIPRPGVHCISGVHRLAIHNAGVAATRIGCAYVHVVYPLRTLLPARFPFPRFRSGATYLCIVPDLGIM